MAASMDFYPGGAEDDDSDEDGFVLGCDDNFSHGVGFDHGSKHNSVLQSLPGSQNESDYSGRGGFGAPPKTNKVGPHAQQRKEVKPKATKQVRQVGLDDFRMAILRGNIDVIKSYVDQGCNVNTVLKGGWTAVMYAASSAYPDIVQLLLKHGADPKSHNDMYTALMAACASTTNRGDDVVKCVNLLIDSGVNVNAHDRYHMSPLIYASREGREDVVEKLLDCGANINKQDSRGWSSLSWAVSKNKINVVKLLISKGANTKLKHCDGLTAIDIAISQDLDEVISLLGGSSTQNQNGYVVSDTQVKYVQPSQSDMVLKFSTNYEGGDTEQSVLKYGELELFLCGLDLGSFVSVFQQQHVDFATFLRMTDEDLIKMGIHQIGVRKKILDGIHDVHKREWEKTSLNSVHYSKSIRCSDAVAMVANISKHSRYISSTVGYIRDQIRTNPQVLEVQDGTSPTQLQENVQDSINNIQTLQDELCRLNTHLCKVLKEKNFDPPDLIKPKKSKKSKLNMRRLFVFSVCVGTVGIMMWKKDVIWDSVSALTHKS